VLENYTQAVKCGLWFRDSAENRLTHILPAVLLPLNMTYVMNALVESRKDETEALDRT